MQRILSVMHDNKAITNNRTAVAGLPSTDAERVAASLAAANSPNTIRAYRGTWKRWHDWASRRGCQTVPAAPAAVVAYITERAESGAAPATVRMDCAGIAAAHRAIGADDPIRREALRQAMRSIVRTNRDKGRGQVQGVDWVSADHVAALAEDDGSVAGLRDGALIRIGSDALLRVSELAALTVADLEVRPDGSGTVTIRRSKTDQGGRGHVRFLGAQTVAAIRRYQQVAGVADGSLLRRVHKGGAVGGPLGVRSIRRIITCRAASAGIGGRVSGHSLRVGAAQSLVAAGQPWPNYSRLGIGSRRACRPITHGISLRRMAPWPGSGTGWRQRRGWYRSDTRRRAPPVCPAWQAIGAFDTRAAVCLSGRRDWRRRSERGRKRSAVRCR